MKNLLFVLILTIGFPLSAAAQKKEQARLENAGIVITEILKIPEGIPRGLLRKADCVVVVPSVLKVAVVLGASYGRGVMTCQTGEKFGGPFGAPSMIALEGASFGLQFGGQATDFVLLLMNSRAASGVLTSKVKLGGDAAVSAGLVGRNAAVATDATLRAEILSYSRSRGVFAGVSLEGSTLRADNRANARLYGKKLDARDIVLKGEVASPPSAKGLLAALNSRRTERSSGN
jgi:SH3 domain-containing YSC84-like protein 1